MINSIIQFTLLENSNNHLIQTYHGEYRNLMYLLQDKFSLFEFGECGGVGRCGTCIIRTKGITGASMIKDRKEPNTLAKMGVLEDEYRLSCQIFITKDLNNSTIELNEETL